MLSKLEQSLEGLYDLIEDSKSLIGFEDYLMDCNGIEWFETIFQGTQRNFTDHSCVQECSMMIKNTSDTKKNKEAAITTLLTLFDVINNIQIISNLLQVEKNIDGPLWFMRFFEESEDHFTINIDQLEQFLKQHKWIQ
jgi:hypothetical protein